jgi:hypothetical protein
MEFLPHHFRDLSENTRIYIILGELESMGFTFDEEMFNDDWCKRAIKSPFDRRTILQVFGLAQILRQNQPITVRGAMYRGIGTLWEDSSEPNYKKCSRLILEMRRLGLIPYFWIVDGTRAWIKPSSWSGLPDFAHAVADSYRKNLWERQKDYIEVFVEKDAMSGVISPVTDEYDVRLNPIRGYGSETFLWSIAEEWKKIEKPIQIYYLGDHDPSGLEIEADLKRRLSDFCGFVPHWERLAITETDFKSTDLLGFPVKKNASRAKWRPYVQRYGDRCVEVDAIPANEIRDRVKTAIEKHIDQREWKFLQDQEVREKADVLTLVRSLGKNS